jgi:hypothetical protein
MLKPAIWIILISISIPKFLPAQNLVPNGDFEKHITFDFSGGAVRTIKFLKDWKPSWNEFYFIAIKTLAKKFSIKQEHIHKSGLFQF